MRIWQAVGRLIYQLVTQEAQVRDLMAWPVPMTPAWKALGENGAWWLELSNKLTNPNPGACCRRSRRCSSG